MIDYKTKPKVFIDRLLLNNLDKQISNNSKTKNNMDSVSSSYKHTSFPINTLSSKVFEMWSGAISENIIVQEKNSSTDMFLAYDEYKNKKSIIIITDNYSDNEINKLESKLDNKLHTIIYCNKNRKKVSSILKKINSKISANSLTNAVTKAYQLVKEGQAIIFPKIDSNFEFFNHVEFA